MDYRITEAAGTVTLSLDGRFTFLDYAKFKPVLERLQASMATAVVVDLDRLEFIDSTGLGLLVAANDVTKERGVALHLVKARGTVKLVLDRAQFSRIMTVD